MTGKGINKSWPKRLQGIKALTDIHCKRPVKTCRDRPVFARVFQRSTFVCYMVAHGSTGMNFVVMHVGTEWHCMCSYSYSVATQCHYDNVHNV